MKRIELPLTEREQQPTALSVPHLPASHLHRNLNLTTPLLHPLASLPSGPPTLGQLALANPPPYEEELDRRDARLTVLNNVR